MNVPAIIDKHFRCVGPNICPIEAGPGKHIRGCPANMRSLAAALVRDILVQSTQPTTRGGKRGRNGDGCS